MMHVVLCVGWVERSKKKWSAWMGAVCAVSETQPSKFLGGAGLGGGLQRT